MQPPPCPMHEGQCPDSLTIAEWLADEVLLQRLDKLGRFPRTSRAFVCDDLLHPVKVNTLVAVVDAASV